MIKISKTVETKMNAVETKMKTAETKTMAVETKMMALDKLTATAPDRRTGKKNIVAFRAYTVKKNASDDHNHSKGTPGISNSQENIFRYSEKLWSQY